MPDAPVRQDVPIPKQLLAEAYQRFLNEQNRDAKNEAGKDLVRAVFGADAIAADAIVKDTLR